VRAADMARFEWAQVVAFDGEALPVLTRTISWTRGRGCGWDCSRISRSWSARTRWMNCPGAQETGCGAAGEASNALTAMPSSRAAAGRGCRGRNGSGWRCIARRTTCFFKRLEPEAYAILTALRDGRTLSAACAAALRDSNPAIDWSARVREWFQTWQALGWFCRRSNRGRA